MAYTPTEWSTGDTITASALNKLENGVANAEKGSKFPTVTVHITHKTGTDSTFSFGYAKYEGSSYNAQKTYSSYRGANNEINWYYATSYKETTTGEQTIRFVSPIPVPKEENMHLVFGIPWNATCSNCSGGMDSSQIAVYFGSVYSGYKVTDDCSFDCYLP